MVIIYKLFCTDPTVNETYIGFTANFAGEKSNTRSAVRTPAARSMGTPCTATSAKTVDGRTGTWCKSLK